MRNNLRGTLKRGPRKSFLTREYVKSLIKKLNLDLDYKEVLEIIRQSNLEIQDKIVEDPNGVFITNIGYFVTIKTKPTKKLQIDYKKTKDLGKPVYHLNLLGDAKVKWFHRKKYKNNRLDCYKFIGCKSLLSKKSINIRSRKFYHTLSERNYMNMIVGKV